MHIFFSTYILKEKGCHAEQGIYPLIKIRRKSPYNKKIWKGGNRVSDPHWFNADTDAAFFLISIPNPDPGFYDKKLDKRFSKGFIKARQASGDAFGPPKRTSSTSKHDISLLFSIFVGHPFWIRIQQVQLMRIRVDPKPWVDSHMND